jgi:hypothetical protein
LRNANGGYAADKTVYDSEVIRADTILVETSDSKMSPPSPHSINTPPLFPDYSANGGYAAKKTVYDSEAIRAVTILVETSDSKMPPPPIAAILIPLSPPLRSANGGYAADKTVYDSEAIRAVTILVETSDSKMPPEDTLGGQDGVYNPDGLADGHVPRNMRLVLAAIDLLQPYVHLTHASPPVVPLSGPAPCLLVEWQVWGAVSVDDSIALWRESTLAPWVELPFMLAGAKRQLSSHIHAAPRSPSADRGRSSHRAMDAQNGTLVEGRLLGGAGVWGGESPFAPATLSGCVRPPSRSLGGQIALSVRADTSWAQPPRGIYAPKRSPQSHLARSRADSGYQRLYRGYEVAGRTRWMSEPIEVNCSLATGCCAVGDVACLQGMGAGWG